MPCPVRLFISYAPADERYCQRLEIHLAPLKREGLIVPWHTRMIEPGSARTDDIERHLAAADIILLLVSADFVATDHLFEDELTWALARHAAGAARVIPVIVTPVDFQKTPFAGLQPLPPGGRPVSTWPDPEAALFDVARGIRRVVERLADAP